MSFEMIFHMTKFHESHEALIKSMFGEIEKRDDKIKQLGEIVEVISKNLDEAEQNIREINDKIGIQ
jgi:HEPN domain-containing protein